MGRSATTVLTSRAPRTRSKLHHIARLVVLCAVVFAVAAASASAAHPVGFYGCRGFTAKHPAAVVRPHSIVIACGDGNLYLTRIHWRAWSAAAAAGSATVHQNDCTPYCAAGHFHAYPGTVALSHPHACKGAVVFTRITWHDRGKTQSTDFGCSSS